MSKEKRHKQNGNLEIELQELRYQLDEANETIEAIRTGQVDALVVQGSNGHQLYTLKSADLTYRVFIEKMTEGAVTLNTQGIILYSNSRFAKMVNLPLSQVMGVSFEEFLAPECKADFRDLFIKCWKVDCKEEFLLSSGEKKTPVQLSLTSLELDEGISLSVILTDLTAQKAAQEQLSDNNRQLEVINMALEASNHDLQQFASVASHDLQEPLRKIQIFSNLIKERESELQPELHNYLDKIIYSADRMKKLIIDILNYSRLSATNTKFELVDLTELVKELRDDFELTIKEKNARIYIGDMPSIDVTRGQIRQVFQNIISNALKFSIGDKVPEIRITGYKIKERSFESEKEDNGPFCLISIQDNGIGFDEKYVKNIFALFERLNAKDKYEGTGIGLSIAKKIIEKHNGLITAKSREGSGAEFKIILPVTQNHL